MSRKTTVPCFHCGEDCGKNPVVYDNKEFCCHGCRVVYDLLKDNKLYTYYELQPSPGQKSSGTEVKGKFYYLDEPEIAETLLDFTQKNISKVTFYIPSIHCSSCIWLLEHLTKLHHGIVKSTVNFPQKTVYITFDNSKINLRQAAELLDSIHYFPSISFDTLQGKPKSKSRSKILYKLGVAGFAFGNIMLLSFPSYFSGKTQTDPEMMRFFQWLNFILSLPVLFYSSTEFFNAAFKNLRKKIINVDLPVAVGILALFFQSVFELMTSSGPGYFDSMAGLVFFLLIGRWYQNKTYVSLSFDRDYKSYFPVAIQKMVEGNWKAITLDKVESGDLLQINNNEIIPADGILESKNAFIDYSFVTGEAAPVQVKSGGKLFAGGRQKGTAIKVRVSKEVSQSYLTQLWNQEIRPGDDKGLTHLLDAVGKYFTIAVLFIATGALVYWFFVAPERAVFVFTSVLIVACPCALALSAPFGLGTALRLMGKNGLFLRNTSMVEEMAKASTIVFDKTGTLTDTREPNIVYSGLSLDKDVKARIKGLVMQSAHPLSQSISAFYDKLTPINPLSIQELAGKGITGNYDSLKITLGSRFWMQEQGFLIRDWLEESDIETSTNVFLAINEKVIGIYKISPQYRDGLDILFSERFGHMNMAVLSGDGPAEKKSLMEMFPPNSSFLFNQTPHQKLAVIRNLQDNNHEHVLMLGDGLNDAGALAEARTGIAVTNDLRTFVPASDGILNAVQIPFLFRYIRLAKKSLLWIKFSIALSFLYNAGGLFFAINGSLTPVVSAILMPLSSVTVVTFVTFATLWNGRNIMKNMK